MGGGSESAGAAKLPEAWKKLQNGSDIRGVALDSIATEPVNLTAKNVALIAIAFAHWVCESLCTTEICKPLDMVRICIGHDSRLSADFMKTNAARGLAHVGVQVFDAGLASTPAMFMSTVLKGYEYDGAIMLTASHLPSNRNGMKFFTSKGGLESANITELLKRACELEADVTSADLEQAKPDLKPVPLMDAYSNHLVGLIRQGTNNNEKPLEGFHIIVDAGNGAGGFFVDKVLKPLGANTDGSQFLEPDGTFPNHIPNPEDAAAMKACSEATLKVKADLGICFDTDVDRAAVVDSSGMEINRDRLIALLAKIVLAEHPGSTIVTDSVTSNGLATFITSLGGVHHRFKRGYKNVINEGIRLNSAGQECHLAIETSGHGAVKENYFLDDGAFLIVKILIQQALIGRGASLGSLISSLREAVEDEEVRFKISPATDFVGVGNRAIAKLRESVATQPGWSLVPNNYEGVRVACDPENGDGWLLLRLSLHDPVLPLNVQSDSKGGVKHIAEKLVAILADITELDFSPLRKYIAAH